jgi:hypothetical protein
MGERLMKYYKFVSDESGLPGKMKLAQKTKIPSTEAALATDSMDNIKLFKEAVKEITGKNPPNF